MNRRDFLRLGGAVSAGVLRLQPSRGRVIVLGAGLAGLAAADDLITAGFDVVVLEARARPGGRVYTLREPFSDGLYADAGAARIQDTHAFTLRYVERLGLTLDPFFPTSGARITVVDGQRFSGPVDLPQLPVAVSEEEKRRGLAGGLTHYLFRHLDALGDVSAPDWPSHDLSSFEVSIPEFCRRQGASPGFLRMVALGHDLAGMSALQFLRDAKLGMATRRWFKIRGGNDRLPRGLAAPLSDRIRYGATVLAIAQHDTGVQVIYERGEERSTLSGDYVICALPPHPLRRIDAPSFPAATRAAINEVGSLAMARVFLQTDERFWLARGESGWAATDDPMDVWDYSRDQPGRRGILGAYLSGRMALHVSALEPRTRGRWIAERMERVHPGLRARLELTASYSWVTDPWALGASAAFDAGQLSALYQRLRQPAGRVHFAGEHTSPWSGWMNGGIESGLRAAAEIRAR